jgi:hypothetical protein
MPVTPTSHASGRKPSGILKGMLRLLLIKLGSNPETRPIVDNIRRRVGPCFIAGVEEKLDVSDSVYDCVLTSHDDALFAAYTKFDIAKLAMTADLYSQVRVFEGQCLRMIDRIKYHNQAEYLHPPGSVRYRDSFQSRSDIVFRHSLFWNHVLNEYNFDAVIWQNFSHLGWDLPLYYFCKSRDIPTFFFHDVGQFPESQFVQEHVEMFGNLQLGKRLREICADNLLPETQNRILVNLTGLQGGPELHRQKMRKPVAQGKSFNTGSIASVLHNGEVRSNFYSMSDVGRRVGSKALRFASHPVTKSKLAGATLRRVVLTSRSKSEEKKLSEFALPTQPFVFFPLHFQPEASTSAKGRHFVEQREAIALVAASLPENYCLVTKEHPHQWRRLYPRPPGFFKNLKEIPRVHLLHHSFENEDILRDCHGVVSISHSTLATEAWARGKKVAFLGDSHLKFAPGVFSGDQVSELSKFWADVSQARDFDQELTTFIRQLELATFEGVLYGTPNYLSSTEARDLIARSQHNLTEIILSWLSTKNLFNYS